MSIFLIVLIILLEVGIFFALTCIWIYSRYKKMNQSAGQSQQDQSLVRKECTITCGVDIGIECPPKECQEKPKRACKCT